MIAKHQPVTTPLGWGRTDPSRDKAVTARAAAIIASVLATTSGQPAIDVHVALGAACPFYSRHDRALWLEEIHRQRGEE